MVTELTFIDRRGPCPIPSDFARFGATLTRLNQLELVRSGGQYGGGKCRVHLMVTGIGLLEMWTVMFFFFGFAGILAWLIGIW